MTPFDRRPPQKSEVSAEPSAPRFGPPAHPLGDRERFSDAGLRRRPRRVWRRADPRTMLVLQRVVGDRAATHLTSAPARSSPRCPSCGGNCGDDSELEIGEASPGAVVARTAASLQRDPVPSAAATAAPPSTAAHNRPRLQMPARLTPARPRPTPHPAAASRPITPLASRTRRSRSASLGRLSTRFARRRRVCSSRRWLGPQGTRGSADVLGHGPRRNRVLARRHSELRHLRDDAQPLP